MSILALNKSYKDRLYYCYNEQNGFLEQAQAQQLSMFSIVMFSSGLEIRPFRKKLKRKKTTQEILSKNSSQSNKKLNFRQQHACRFKIYDRFLLKTQGILEKTYDFVEKLNKYAKNSTNI